MVPDVLLPSITCQAEFVPLFLNLLRDWTSAAWSSRNKSTNTPLKAQTPVTGENHSANRSSMCDTPYSMPDQQTRSYSSICTPDSNPRLDNRLASAQRFGSVKSRMCEPSDMNRSMFSPQEANSVEHPSHRTKHRPLKHNTVLHTEYLTTSTRERQGRALFSDGLAPASSCNMKKPAGKHKTPVRNRTEKIVKAPVPSFNLDSNTDFPDMRSSTRYLVWLFLYSSHAFTGIDWYFNLSLTSST